ncbi:hypothetical protein EV193_105220 [Herbihabitans rhizosphaerae]|uniref:Membrane-associated oxidoreductase n=1 Tax=Herbihabitans rhizosphaerae TaxID=1872711 RepID=A0A4Q7KQQ8_9PSEU|nr:hypothetical protein [Herbihabitans rhizosphaerae]RZS37662.1 hypothetical protein EV193_105220 [Herbihabitans rhizosphaerae]
MFKYVGPEELTDTERELCRAFTRGDQLDLSDREDRQIRGGVLAALLTDSYPGTGQGLAALHLVGATITDSMDVTGRTIKYLIDMERCVFERSVGVAMAKLVGLRMSGCHVQGFRGQNVTVESDLRLEAGFTSRKFVDLTDARVRGTLRLEGAILDGGGRPAFLGARLRVTGSVQAIAMRAFGEVRLRGAHIGGNLHFTGVKLSNPGRTALEGTGLIVDGNLMCDQSGGGRFESEGRMHLAGANIGGAAVFSGALLHGADGDAGPAVVLPRGRIVDSVVLAADRLKVDGDLRLDAGFTATGTVGLRGAEIGGHLQLSGATVGRAEWIEPLAEASAAGHAVDAVPVALVADGIRVGGDVEARGARKGSLRNGEIVGEENTTDALNAYGQVRLVDAHVRGSASLSGARLIGPAIDVLFADRLTIGGTLFLRRLSARGSVRMQNAHVGSTLDCSGADLTEPRLRADDSIKPSLDLRVGTIGKDLLCSYGFRAVGGVRARLVEVGKIATFADARLGMEEPPTSGRTRNPLALNAYGLSAQQLILTFPKGRAPAGGVLLTRARVVSFVDGAELWAASGGVEVEDFTYDAIEARPEVAVSVRLAWMRTVQPDFAPGPYERLAQVYRDGGDEERARQVQLERQRRRYAELGPAGRLWGFMQEWTVGYGYRPWLAMVWLAVFWVFGTLWFLGHEMVKLDNDQNPAWSPPMLSLDLLVPIVDLGQDRMWRMTGASQWISGVLIALGWVLASTAAAGATRVLKRN